MFTLLRSRKVLKLLEYLGHYGKPNNSLLLLVIKGHRVVSLFSISTFSRMSGEAQGGNHIIFCILPACMQLLVTKQTMPSPKTLKCFCAQQLKIQKTNGLLNALFFHDNLSRISHLCQIH